MCLAISGLVASCDMDTEVAQYKDAESAFNTVSDLSNAINGAYYYLGSTGFAGRNVIAFGDCSSGVTKGSEAKGWFAAIGQYSISTSESEFKDCYNNGYKVIDQTTRIIKGGTGINGAEQYVAEAHGLRALSNWYLVNLFGLPLHSSASTLGLILVDEEPIEAFQEVHRSTVAETYALIEKDINTALSLFDKAGDRGAFYMNKGAVEALKARVALDKADYSGAITAAKAAIDWRATGAADAADANPSNEEYVSMWTNGSASVAETSEDIFSILKSSSWGNSLSTLYNSYENVLSIWSTQIFDQENDIRWQLVDDRPCGYQPMKYRGTSVGGSIANVPLMRKSEMALILAEAYAQQGDIAQAKNYLTYTAKRNVKFESEILPTINTKDDVMAFLQNERVREFFAEGHYWFDARRLGYKVQSNYYKNFDIQKFCFPIPEAEISANAGVEQNTDWHNNVPK